jgi:TolB-like protein
MRGYRLVAEVSKTEAPPPQVAAAARPEASQLNRRLFATLAAAGLALIVALGLWVLQRGATPTSPAPDTKDPALRTVAVLPFKNLTGDSADAAIALGVPDIVLDRLTTVEGLTVVARDSAFRAGEQSADPAEISRRLRAAFLVDGTVQRSGTMLRVSARLVDARAGQTLWSTRYDRPIEGLFAMQDDIATQVAAALQGHISGMSAPAAATAPTRDVEAYLAWLRGRTLIGRDTAAKADAAAAEFQQAIEWDPGFAAAYAALYDARMQAAALRFEDTEAARRRNRPLLERALALNPRAGDVLFAQAMWDDLDDATRESTFREAAHRDPGNSRGLTSFAAFLYLISNREVAGKLRGSGLFPPHYGPSKPDGDARVVEATRLLERAIEIDPLSASARFLQYDQSGYSDRESADSQLQSLLAVDPDYYPALQRLAKYRWWFHDSPSQAIAIIERAIAADPQNPLAYHSAAAFYLDIDEAVAAAEVAAATPVSAITTAAALELYDGNWRSAALAARKEEGFVFEGLEDSGNAQALRDYALRTREFEAVEALLCERYAMTMDGPVAIDLYNFRIWVLLAHLQLAQGNAVRANQVLESVIAWIDAEYGKYGPVFERRTRAQALMLLGRREDALRELAASFAVDHDHVEWWYVIERDPVWNEVRDTAEFRALAAGAQRFAARERAAVEELRREGKIPQRPAT